MYCTLYTVQSPIWNSYFLHVWGGDGGGTQSVQIREILVAAHYTVHTLHIIYTHITHNVPITLHTAGSILALYRNMPDIYCSSRVTSTSLQLCGAGAARSRAFEAVSGAEFWCRLRQRLLIYPKRTVAGKTVSTKIVDNLWYNLGKLYCFWLTFVKNFSVVAENRSRTRLRD